MNWRQFFWRGLPPLVWVGLIYLASSMSYQQQDLRPTLGEWNLEWVRSLFSWVSFTYSESIISIETRGTAAFVEFFIRKGAHVFVFLVLGFFIFRLIKVFNLHLFIQVISSIMFIVIFASIDEYRHFNNPGRTGLIEDVILDSISGTIGVCIAIATYNRLNKF